MGPHIKSIATQTAEQLSSLVFNETTADTVNLIFQQAISSLHCDPEEIRELASRVKEQLPSSYDSRVQEVVREHIFFRQIVNCNAEEAIATVRDHVTKHPHHLSPRDERGELLEAAPVLGASIINIANTREISQREIRRERPKECLQMLNWGLREWRGIWIKTSGDLKEILEDGAEPRDTVPVLLTFLTEQEDERLSQVKKL